MYYKFDLIDQLEIFYEYLAQKEEGYIIDAMFSIMGPKLLLFEMDGLLKEEIEGYIEDYFLLGEKGVDIGFVESMTENERWGYYRSYNIWTDLKSLIQFKETRNYLEDKTIYLELELAFEKFLSDCFRLVRHSEYVKRYGDYFELSCRVNNFEMMSFELNGCYIDEESLVEEILLNSSQIPGFRFGLKN